MLLKKINRLILCLFIAGIFMSCGGGNNYAWEDENNMSEGDSGGVPPRLTNPVWTELANTRLADSVFDWSSQGGSPGVMGVHGITAFSGAAFDTTRNRLLIHGGGHGDYGGQEIYAFDLDTLNWSMVAPPENKVDLRHNECSVDTQINFGRRTVNNLPKSVHTYDRLVYVEQLDALFDGRASVGFRECYGIHKEAALFDFKTNQWEWWADPIQHPDDILYPAGVLSVGGAGAAAAIHPITKEIWFVPSINHGRLTRWNPTTGEWAQGRSDNWMYLTSHKVAMIDPVRNDLIIKQDAGTARFYIIPLGEFTQTVTRPQDYVATSMTGDTEFLSFEQGRRITLDYDPVGDQLVAWAGGADFYTMNMDTHVWTQHTASGDIPGNASTAGTYGRFRYVASIDKFLLMNGVGDNVRLLDLRAGQTVVSFDLSSEVTGDVPFTAGVAFKQGDVPGTPTFSLDNYQVKVKRRWVDDSVKHAIVSGTYPSVADTPFTVEVFDRGEVPAGVDLTNADIIVAAPRATVDLGEHGSVSLEDLLATPKRTWLQGPEMVEIHYQAQAPGNNFLSVWFQVRLYASGQMRIRTNIDYGFITPYDMPSISYLPVVTIGDTVVYDNGEKSISQHRHTRWTAEGWIGTPDPNTTIRHDTAYLTDTKLVPNYWKHNPSEASLNNLSQSYSPMTLGNVRQRYGSAGYHQQIGLLPRWDVLYLTSGGDSRAYKAVVANGKSFFTHGLIWSDPNTYAPFLPSLYPKWSFWGNEQGTVFTFISGPNSWAVSHQPSTGYLAYILTGDYHFLEALQYSVTNIYLATTYARGQGSNRALARFEKRGDAWAIRSVGQLAAIAPIDDLLTHEMASILASTVNWHNNYRKQTQNQSGYFHYFPWSTWDGRIPSWEYDLLSQSLGHVSDLGVEDLIDTTNLIAVRDHSYKAVVGRLGGNGIDQYCYTKAGDMVVYVVPEGAIRPDPHAPDTWFDSWGDIYERTFGVANTDCGTVMEGHGEFGPSPFGYWANMLPALSYAVEHGAPGAAEGLNRLTSSDNFVEDFETSGFENNPVWGIWPRGVK